MRRAFLALAAFAVVAASAQAADWPQWRGPNRDGVAPDSPTLVDSFPKEGPKKAWESEPIPGGDKGGFSQPVVAEGKVFVFYNCRFDRPIAVRTLTRAELTALGWMSGIAWKSKPLGPPSNTHNRSSSALLLGDKLVVGNESQLVALDVKTGEVAWSNRALGDEAASPVAWTSGGRTLLLAAAGGKLAAVDPADGKTVWSVPAGTTGSTPVVSGDVAVFCTSGKDIGLVAYRLKPDGAEKLWSVPLIEWGASVLISGKHVWAVGGGNGTEGFGEKNKGRAVCVEIETGKVAWDEPLGPGAEPSSPILADGKLLAEVGPWLFLIKASPDKHELLDKAGLGLASWTSPAFSDGFLFVRTGKNVACYDLRKP